MIGIVLGTEGAAGLIVTVGCDTPLVTKVSAFELRPSACRPVDARFPKIFQTNHFNYVHGAQNVRQISRFMLKIMLSC